jgi:branched-chain amino acid transport system substrate-binding protein
VKKATIILGVAVCSVIALSGCSAATGGGGSSNSLKFAVVGPFSGDNAAFGEAQVNGIQIAVDQINKGGGINGKSVAIEKFDDKCDPTEAASVASRIASDGNFEAVLGHLCSSSTLAALPVYQRAGLSVFSASSSNPKISKGGYGNFTRNISTDDVQGGQLIDFAKKLDKKRIGIVYASDDYGQGLYDSAVKKAKESGAEIVAAESRWRQPPAAHSLTSCPWEVQPPKAPISFPTTTRPARCQPTRSM